MVIRYVINSDSRYLHLICLTSYTIRRWERVRMIMLQMISPDTEDRVFPISTVMVF
jgi:hypothetical protein